LAAPLRAEDKEKAEDTAARLAVAKAIAPSLVRVEYTLQYDKGEPPQALGYTRGYYGGDAESVVRDERPFEVPGYLLAPDKVLVPDPVIHPRFIKSISVHQGDGKAGEVAEATPAAYGKEQGAVLLKLSAPMKSAKPLAFDKSKKGPYLAVTYSPGEGEWTTSVQPAGGTVVVTSRDRKMVAVPNYCLITDAEGTPVGMAMKEDLPPDDSWKGSPADWPLVSAEELASLTGRIEKAAQQGLPRVTLNFRSPKAKPGGGVQMRYGPMGNDEDQNSTVRHVNGVMVDEKTVLVLAELKGNVTARLDGIRVNTADGKSVPAKFGHTLLDYGAFVATLEKPLPGAAVKVAKVDVLDLRSKLLPAAHLQLQGERRREYYGHRRLQGFATGWRRQVYPTVPGDAQNLFLFDAEGSLVALPVERREKAGVADQNRHYGPRDQALLTPVSYLWPAVQGDPAKYADAGNVPLSEEDESRLAWLGVELQALTPDLARANEVSHLTNDGRSGALVTYVYPNSPAAAAGLEPGWILLRIHVAELPKPIEVQIEPYAFADQPFPWDRFDELPEQYFDRIPQPWPALENNFTRSLTDLGFGKKFTAEFSNGGKTLTREFDVKQSPPHFDSAPKYKSDPIGVTVKDQTYEVRRYFQRSNEEPGVILAKIEMGSKASIAGLKPFEVITHVNDQPVHDVKEFEKLTKGQETLRLSVKRMTKGRQVKVSVGGAKEEKPAKPEAAGAPKEEREEPKPEGE
jgi:hypothetical protein